MRETERDRERYAKRNSERCIERDRERQRETEKESNVGCGEGVIKCVGCLRLVVDSAYGERPRQPFQAESPQPAKLLEDALRVVASREGGLEEQRVKHAPQLGRRRCSKREQEGAEKERKRKTKKNNKT